MSALAAVLLTAPLLAHAPAAQPAAGTWTIDTNHSSATFSVKHLMVSTVRGSLGPVKGTIEYDGTSVESIKADVVVDVTGLNSGSESRDRDLKGAEFFDIQKYPTATFKSRRAVSDGAGKFRLIGDLTIRGVTKEVTLDVEGPTGPLKQGTSLRAGASATTTITRQDFGLLYNRVVEAVPSVADTVNVTIDIEAVKRGA
jgi:polyisoprenoid-binding protein YceI